MGLMDAKLAIYPLYGLRYKSAMNLPLPEPT